MKKLFIAVLFLGSLVTQASMLDVNDPLESKIFDTHANDDKTYFDTLGDFFEKGARPDISKISNIAWAGRCFVSLYPYDPIAAAYLIRKVDSNVGPISTNNEYEASFIFVASFNSPDHFDNMSFEDIEQLMLKEFGASAFDRVFFKNNSITEENNDTFVSTRSYGDYLVKEIREVKDAGPIATPGKVLMRCYYFIPGLNHI